jgi:small subunit ribosomal protein S1
VGDELEGAVTKVVTFGAFVEILDGVEGLVHISELANHHVENPREVVQPGDVVRVRVLEIDSERRRLSLSVKRVEGQTLPSELRAAAGEPFDPGTLDDATDLGLSEEVFMGGATPVPDAELHADEALADPAVEAAEVEGSPEAADAVEVAPEPVGTVDEAPAAEVEEASAAEAEEAPAAEVEEAPAAEAEEAPAAEVEEAPAAEVEEAPAAEAEEAPAAEVEEAPAAEADPATEIVEPEVAETPAEEPAPAEEATAEAAGDLPEESATEAGTDGDTPPADQQP